MSINIWEDGIFGHGFTHKELTNQINTKIWAQNIPGHPVLALLAAYLSRDSWFLFLCSLASAGQEWSTRHLLYG